MLAASIQNYKIAALMALTLPMVYTSAILLILHTYFALGLMELIQDPLVMFHIQIFKLAIPLPTTYLALKLMFKTAQPTFKI